MKNFWKKVIVRKRLKNWLGKNLGRLNKMLVTKKSSINRKLKELSEDDEILADIIVRQDVERWCERRFSDCQWAAVKEELSRRWDIECIPSIQQTVAETLTTFLRRGGDA